MRSTLVVYHAVAHKPWIFFISVLKYTLPIYTCVKIHSSYIHVIAIGKRNLRRLTNECLQYYIGSDIQLVWRCHKVRLSFSKLSGSDYDYGMVEICSA